MPNPFVHVELSTTDASASKTFYAKLFDWTMQDTPTPHGDYTLISVGGGGTGGGIMQQANMPSTWLAYVDVDDINAATQKAKSLGATVVQEVMEVKDMGWFSIIIDPTGAKLGLWKTKT